MRYMCGVALECWIRGNAFDIVSFPICFGRQTASIGDQEVSQRTSI